MLLAGDEKSATRNRATNNAYCQDNENRAGTAGRAQTGRSPRGRGPDRVPSRASDPAAETLPPRPRTRGPTVCPTSFWWRETGVEMTDADWHERTAAAALRGKGAPPPERPPMPRRKRRSFLAFNAGAQRHHHWPPHPRGMGWWPASNTSEEGVRGRAPRRGQHRGPAPPIASIAPSCWSLSA